MRIAVYSGSFNPLHRGHEAIMEYLVGDRLFDRVYLVVSPQSPFKDESNVASAQARFDAAVEAVRRHPHLNVVVDDIELGMEPPHYTIRTLDALKLREPCNSFTLVTGADQLYDFRRWKDYGRILLEYGLLVFPRSGYDAEELREDLLRENPAFRIDLAAAPLVDVSSTEIRDALASGRDMSEYLM
ncbi:MAG: nicotinate (nicotinamide) nucleotide adenylyltransferase [Bacteroidales bacterium]|nr:nicotinate (nicotinamide) nucleotide adenylyltransferase [Bacteroidales bacterium]